MITFSLDPPANGLTGRNWYLLAQFSIGAIVCVLAIIYRIRVMVPESRLTRQQHMIAGFVFVVTVLTTEAIIGSFYYPVPFTSLTTSSLAMCLFSLTWMYFEDKTVIKTQLYTPLLSLVSSFTLLLIHEAIGVLYTSQRDSITMQTAVGFLLPIFKIMARYYYLWLFRNSKEGLGSTLVAFEIQFFSSLYTSAFLQKTDSIFTIVGPILFDILENWLSVYRIYRLSKDETIPPSKVKNRILFRTEMVLLYELVEVAIPIMSGLFLLGIRHHPNFAYMKGLRELSDEAYDMTLWNLFFLMLFELLNVVILKQFLQSQYHLPLLNQMAFTIKQYQAMISYTMSIWFLVALTNQYEHMGSDYTFHFKAVSS